MTKRRDRHSSGKSIKDCGDEQSMLEVRRSLAYIFISVKATSQAGQYTKTLDGRMLWSSAGAEQAILHCLL